MNDGGDAPEPRPSGRTFEARLEKRGGAVECLRIPSLAFGMVASLRSELYESGLLTAHRAGVPVFSVGNISTGGTGKTPFVVWLARELCQRGRRVGILSRGYGAEPGAQNDEAVMLSRCLPDVPHVQDRDRVRGARVLVERGTDALVLDDGFQHRRIARDVDVVLVDATRPWGLPRDAGGKSVRALLPRGLLREAPHALARASAIVLTRVDQVPAAWLAQLEDEIEALAPGVPRVHAVHAARALQKSDGTREPLSSLAGREVELVSGIGNPEAFARSVKSLGAIVASERRFADHHAFTKSDLEPLPRNGRLLLCTAKDQVKLAALGIACAALEIELELRSSGLALEALIDAALHAEAPSRTQGRLP
ncbi:MAG TPA: tetraacyldisaccharide 4'-kinase [Planctomycetota bacterium]|nr:tetraacyldisaccharide 4'-kinase [Planctomycetota bacterium]